MTTKTVLLIEDDRDSRFVYSTVLRHSGFEVVEATDGAEAAPLAQQHRPDVIVMDLRLPFVDGWQATEVLKGDPDTAHIPVIAVSVHLQPLDRSRAQDAGCDSFLPKPCPPTRLVQEIQRMLPEA